MNTLKTVGLMTFLTVILVFAGGALGGQSGALMALILSKFFMPKNQVTQTGIKTANSKVANCLKQKPGSPSQLTLKQDPKVNGHQTTPLCV